MSQNVAQIPDGVMVKNGEPVVVIRPRDPVKAIAMARDIEDRQRLGRISANRAHREFCQILDKQAYQFVGFLRADEAMVINAGPFPPQPLQPGDSFISLSSLAKFENLSARARNN